jgi:PQQ-dependent catabolism-associated CXXCW motif protein
MAAALFAMLALAAPAAAQIGGAPVPEPADYRMDDYRAPTPATIKGGTALTTAQLRALLHGRDVVLIDVLPRQRRPDNLPASTLWIEKPREDIPGSVWLPDVGRGALSPETERYFRDNLDQLTNGDKQRRVVFYCLADCWMSWNAAKRAIEYGYRQVYWYRDGTDGWASLGLPTEERQPVPISGQ